MNYYLLLFLSFCSLHFICPEFLETLPEREMLNGHVEMLKHGIIADKSHYDKVKCISLTIKVWLLKN